MLHRKDITVSSSCLRALRFCRQYIGNLWAARSNGRCLFAMPSDGDFTEIVKAIK